MSRDAVEVVGAAVRANRRAAAAGYALAVAAIAAGVAAVVAGVVVSQSGMMLIGLGIGGAYWLAAAFAARCRETNAVLRAVENPLGMTGTEAEIARTLRAVAADLGPHVPEATWGVKPPHTFASVTRELADGLDDGTVTLRRPSP